MYQLLVYYPGEPSAREIVSAERGEVTALIPGLLRLHPACERIVATADHMELFALDYMGNALPLRRPH